MQEWSHRIDLHMTCMPHIYEPGAWSFMLWLCGVKTVIEVCEALNSSPLWEVLGSQSLPCGALSSKCKQPTVSIASPLLCATS